MLLLQADLKWPVFVGLVSTFHITTPKITCLFHKRNPVIRGQILIPWLMQSVVPVILMRLLLESVLPNVFKGVRVQPLLRSQPETNLLAISPWTQLLWLLFCSFLPSSKIMQCQFLNVFIKQCSYLAIIVVESWSLIVITVIICFFTHSNLANWV